MPEKKRNSALKLPNLPGFTAEHALRDKHGVRGFHGISSLRLRTSVEPQSDASEFGCGLAIAALAGGFLTFNPSLAFGGVWAIGRFC